MEASNRMREIAIEVLDRDLLRRAEVTEEQAQMIAFAVADEIRYVYGDRQLYLDDGVDVLVGDTIDVIDTVEIIEKVSDGLMTFDEASEFVETLRWHGQDEVADQLLADISNFN